MEGSSNRAEAERWLSIAEKLLTAHDLLGSKTFAIRARESDPKLESSDQILAVADTLLAGEKRVNNQNDWYAVLQLARQTQDSELIATQYRRLALLLNPEKNKLAFADQAFKLVSDAWSVLSNPSKKSLYDNELNLYSKLDPIASTTEHSQQQQQRQSTRRSHINKDTTVDESHNVTQSQGSSFWTACPYCYNLYEYPRVYEECSLRCQNCQRAFHAVLIPSPPPVYTGKEAYFCCWGFFPLGFSMPNSESGKDNGGFSNWVPFSPMFNCPSRVEERASEETRNAGEGTRSVARPKNVNVKKSTAPKVYKDDQDVFVEVSDPSDDSDDEWGSTRKKKKAKNVKARGSAGKNVKKAQAEKVKKGSQNLVGQVKGGDDEALQGGSVMQEGMGVPNLSKPETSKKAVANNSKKQMGKGAKELGKLDLNVEFSNEVEEPAPGMSEGNRTGNGEEDGIEGIGFFEGLDEFLSSLPILSVVGDDKVKTA